MYRCHTSQLDFRFSINYKESRYLCNGKTIPKNFLDTFFIKRTTATNQPQTYIVPDKRKNVMKNPKI